ncbi:MAG TPA: diguanylate cyclase, partial [Dehalococcoidia bacterium]|nr:diguanylate cyclase [Dehalococcoidia bacterium]
MRQGDESPITNRLRTTMQAVRPCRLWPLCSVRGRIIAGFALLVLILVGVVAGSAWLAHEHRATVSGMERDAAVVSLLKDAKLSGVLALVLLQQYVITGDESMVPVMRSYWGTGIEDLAKAQDFEAARGHLDVAATLNQLRTQAGPLSQAFAEIMALRKSGDLNAAAAALQATVVRMQPLQLGFDQAAAEEVGEASAVTDRAGATSALAFWLLITSGAIGTVVALGSAAFVARSILKPLSSLEATARAVTGGDLNTRAPTAGPRELAHLGITLNSMLAQLTDREQDLRLANQELQERNRQLLDARSQAATDPLTGLLNHRAFHERIREEVDRARAVDARVSLVMLDIDNFKAVNDSLGHQAGDRILRDIALTLAEEVGVTGAYRYGGDEFALLLPGMDHRAAFRLGERLRALLRDRSDGHRPRVTVSMGVADFPSTAKSSDELIYGADAAMYWAKSEGKDRVGRWGDLLRRRAQGTLPWYAADAAIREPDVVAALTAALAAKDPDTRAHTERCSWYAARLAEELGLDERETSIVRLSSLLHDIGKLAVPDDILFKPGPLN